MTLTVRIATAADAAELSRVGMQSFNDAYRGTADDADIDAHLNAYFSAAAIRDAMTRPSVRYLVASSEGATAGLVKLRNDGVPRQIDVDLAVEVQQLYVTSDFQRRGVGGRLMDAAAAEARHEQAEGIWLSVWTQADWAVAFYRSYGFAIVGEAPFQLGRSEFIDYLMWYAID